MSPIEEAAKVKYLKKRRVNPQAPLIHDKRISKSFQQFLQAVQKSNCLMWSLHGLSVFDLFIVDRSKLPKNKDQISASIMNLMLAIADARLGSTTLQITQLMTIDMNRCELVDES